jgi:hypothetical protein
MNKHNYVVIMAGGIGSRFWPMSRQDFPKQFLDILNTGKTLIQWTYERFASFIPGKNILCGHFPGICGHRARTTAATAGGEYPGRAIPKEHGALYRLYVFQVAADWTPRHP